MKKSVERITGDSEGVAYEFPVFRFEGSEDEIAINPPPGGHAAEFDAWEWKRMEELPELIVPFKRDVYLKVVEAFRHLV